MKHIKVTLALLGIALLTFLLASCGQAATKSIPTATSEPPTPTPDTSIIWSDDFEEGNIDGWEIISNNIGDFSGENKFLSLEEYIKNKFVYTIIERPSPVTSGTWSFDFLYPEIDPGHLSCFVGLISNISLNNEYKEDRVYYWFGNPDLQSLALDIGYEKVFVTLIFEGKKIVIGQSPIKDFSKWHHIDVTRDEDGRTLVYHNGEQIVDYSDDRFSDSQVFYIVCDHPTIAFDNVVVRDKVIDILPPSE